MRVAVIGDTEDVRQLVSTLTKIDCKEVNSEELVESIDDEVVVVGPSRKTQLALACVGVWNDIMPLFAKAFDDYKILCFGYGNNFDSREPLYRNHNRIQHRQLQRNNKLSRAEYKRRGSKFKCKNSRLKKK